MAKGKHAKQVVVAMARELRAFMWAMAKQVAGAPKASRGQRIDADACKVSNVYRQRRSPGVVEPSAAFRGPTGPRVPQGRQAPDGGKEGGTQPTESSQITRRLFLAPPLFMRTGANHDADLKKVVPDP